MNAFYVRRVMSEKFEKLCKEADSHLESERRAQEQIYKNTLTALSFIDTKKEYIKYLCSKHTIEHRYKRAMMFITDNIGTVNEKVIRRKLFKIGIFRERAIYLMWFVPVNLVHYQIWRYIAFTCLNNITSFDFYLLYILNSIIINIVSLIPLLCLLNSKITFFKLKNDDHE